MLICRESTFSYRFFIFVCVCVPTRERVLNIALIIIFQSCCLNEKDQLRVLRKNQVLFENIRFSRNNRFGVLAALFYDCSHDGVFSRQVHSILSRKSKSLVSRVVIVFCLFFFVIVSDDGLLCRKSNLAELFLLSGNIFSGIDIDIGRQLIQSPPASHICLCSRKNKKTKKQNKNGWEFGLSHSLFSIVLLSIERKERRRSFLYAVFIQPYAAINTKKKLMPVSIYY